MKKQGSALVTGASRGIGAAIARRLAADGYKIWANYRSNHIEAKKLQKSIEEAGGECILLPFDVTDSKGVKEVLVPLLEKETPEILVNNAGYVKDSLLMWMSEEDWQGVTDVILKGFYNVTKQVIFGMMKKRKGRIINIASTAGESGLGGQTNYSAAKAGLIGATKSLAKEVAKRNILVNAVSPGFIATEMIENLPLEEIIKSIPLGRIGRVEDVAAAVSFLCSEESAYITGQVVAVNGGIHI